MSRIPIHVVALVVAPIPFGVIVAVSISRDLDVALFVDFGKPDDFGKPENQTLYFLVTRMARQKTRENQTLYLLLTRVARQPNIGLSRAQFEVAGIGKARALRRRPMRTAEIFGSR